MSSAALFGYCGAVLVGLGLYGLITRPEVLRKILSFNVLGSGVFLLFGVFARRGAAAGFGADPVPQALVITGIVVAFSATALAVALLVRLNKETGQIIVTADDSEESGEQGDGLRDGDRLLRFRLRRRVETATIVNAGTMNVSATAVAPATAVRSPRASPQQRGDDDRSAEPRLQVDTNAPAGERNDRQQRHAERGCPPRVRERR